MSLNFKFKTEVFLAQTLNLSEVVVSRLNSNDVLYKGCKKPFTGPDIIHKGEITC